MASKNISFRLENLSLLLTINGRTMVVICHIVSTHPALFRQLDPQRGPRSGFLPSPIFLLVDQVVEQGPGQYYCEYDGTTLPTMVRRYIFAAKVRTCWQDRN